MSASRTLPRLVAALGFALLCYAAYDTIHYRHRLQVAGEEFEWPNTEAQLALAAGSALCLYAGLRLLADFVPITVQKTPPNPEALYFRPSFMSLNHRGTYATKRNR